MHLTGGAAFLVSSLILQGTVLGADTRYVCDPALRVFCKNVHVGCSGATKFRTSTLHLSLTGTTARVEAEGYDGARSGQLSAGRDVLIHMNDRREWIRIEPDGRFSHRVYRRHGPVMSYGLCRQVTGTR